MLRLIFVSGIIVIGAFYSLHGPFYALLFYLWNAYFRPESWVWNDILWSLRLSLIIGAFLVLASLPSLQRFRASRQVWLIIIFLVHSGISAFASPHQALALPFWVEFVKVIIITLLITVLVDSEERLRLTFAVIAYSLGFEAAKQGWAQFVLNPGATNTNPHLMLGDNNGVALGMMMLIPIFMALSQTTSNRWAKYIHRFFIAGVVYRAISTYSRGGFLATALVGLVSLWRSKHRIRTIVTVAVLALAVSSVMPQTFWDRMQTIAASEDDRDASARSRIYYWGLATDMANDHPFFGVGVNSFRYSFSQYDASGAFGGQRAVHSAWFGLLSEVGYPGFLLFAAILLGALHSCHRIRKRAAAAGLTNISIYAGHLQTSLLVFIVGGSFLNTQYLELLWHFFGLTIALENIYAKAVEDAGALTGPRAGPVPIAVAAEFVPRPGTRRTQPAASTGHRHFFK